MTEALTVTTPTDTQIVMTRTFNASRQLVWEAMTSPDMLRKWLFSPPGWEMVKCEEDLREGGRFKWEWAADGKTVMCLSGEYQVVSPPSADGSGGRIVRTESGCLPGGGEVKATLQLSEVPGTAGRTELTMTLEYPNREIRDQMIEMGMTQGMDAGYNTLDTILQS